MTKEKIMPWFKKIVFVFFFILLTLSFKQNILSVVSWNHFLIWQEGSESLVLGRVIRARQEGLSAEYNLLQRDLNWREENAFITEDYVEFGILYYSQIGLQGFVYAVVDRVLPINNHNKLKLFYFINSLLLAIMIGLISFWAIKHFNYLSGLAVLIGGSFSYWLVLSARNMFWVIWTMLLPFVVILYLHWLEAEKDGIKVYGAYFLLASFFSVFIRLANGFEFTSHILLTTLFPIFFYALRDNWNKKKLVYRVFFVGSGGFFAFVVSILLNLWQRAMSLGSFSLGWNNMRENIGYRTLFFETSDERQLIIDSLNAHVLEVIEIYMRNIILVFDYRMIELLLFCVICALCIVLSGNRLLTISENYKKLISLVVVTYISLLAPMSWFILGKGHSYIHTHINAVLWNFPSTLLIYALVGAVISYAGKDLWGCCHNFTKKGIFILSCFLLFSWPVIRTYEAWEWNTNMQSIQEIKKEGEQVFRDNEISVYLFGDLLLYSVSRDSDSIVVRHKVHVMPLNSEDMPEEYQGRGFGNRSFNFMDREINTPFWESNLYSIVELPAFDIEMIVIGQYEKWSYDIKVQ